MSFPVNTGNGTKNFEAFEANITHNLNEMAIKGSFYEALWHQEGVSLAQDLIEPLTQGISSMERFPEQYKVLGSTSGWGTYCDFLPWLKKLLVACEEYPLAQVNVSI